MKTILLLTDFSRKADHAADVALAIATRLNAQILLYNAFVVPELVPIAGTALLPDGNAQMIEDDSSSRLRKLAQRLKAKIDEAPDLPFKPPVFCLNEAGTIADNITGLVKKKQIWMVVMGTKGDNGISNFLFGSNAFSAIDKANCPVLLIPEKAEMKKVNKIALATDLQISNIKSAEFLAEFAEGLLSEIVIAHVSPNGEIDDGNHQDAKQFVKQLMTQLHHVNSSYQDIQGDEVERRLEEFSLNEQVDILAVIHRRYNLIERIFHSSTTKVLIRHSKVPLLVLPA